MNHDLSDNDIFQTLREGSEEAFGTLFRRYYPRLHRFACKYIADEAAASDAVQTCFMRLWERRSTLVGGSLQSMLYTMLRNECLNSLKHTAIVEGYARQAQSVADTEPLYNADFLGAADHQLLYDELQLSIDRALDTLPQRTADIFRMSRYESLKNREIASSSAYPPPPSRSTYPRRSRPLPPSSPKSTAQVLRSASCSAWSTHRRLSDTIPANNSPRRLGSRRFSCYIVMTNHLKSTYAQ